MNLQQQQEQQQQIQKRSRGRSIGGAAENKAIGTSTQPQFNRDMHAPSEVQKISGSPSNMKLSPSVQQEALQAGKGLQGQNVTAPAQMSNQAIVEKYSVKPPQQQGQEKAQVKTQPATQER